MEAAQDRLRLLDSIVGRCIRDLEFGERVLREPEAALLRYDLSEEEMDDFRALSRYADEALPRWQRLHAVFYAHTEATAKTPR